MVQNINALDSRLILCFARRRTAFGRFYALPPPINDVENSAFLRLAEQFSPVLRPIFLRELMQKIKKINTFQLVMLVAFLQGNSKKN